MIEMVGLENILWFVIIALCVIGFQMDRFSRKMVNHIDKLQDRVDVLEKKLGIKKESDINPLGFISDDK